MALPGRAGRVEESLRVERFRVPMQFVPYESGEHKAWACVLILLPKTAWMLKQEAR